MLCAVFIKTAGLASSQESATKSPIRKRVKNADDEPPASLPVVANTKKTAKAKTTSRTDSKAVSRKAAAPAHDAKRTKQKDVDLELAHASNDREVFKAIAGHAAATAAIKRYNLRSAHHE